MSECPNVSGSEIPRRRRNRRKLKLSHKKCHKGGQIKPKEMPPEDCFLSPGDRDCLAIEHNYSLNENLTTNGNHLECHKDFSLMENQIYSEISSSEQNIIIKEEIIDDVLDNPEIEGTYSTADERILDVGKDTSFFRDEVKTNQALKNICKSGKGTSSSTLPDLDLLIEVDGRIRNSLPERWISVISDGGIHLLMMSKGKVMVSQRDLFVCPGGEMELSVHGQYVPDVHQIWTQLHKPSQLNSLTPPQFAQYLCLLASIVDSYQVCPGITSDPDHPIWRMVHDIVIDENLFHETHFSRSVRSKHCLALVPKNSEKRCSLCEKVRFIISHKYNSVLKHKLEYLSRSQNPSAVCFSFMPST